jgi:hypothetical protein
VHKETVVACARMVTEGRVGELGAAYLDRRDKTKVAQRLARRITDLGYEVHLNVAAA